MGNLELFRKQPMVLSMILWTKCKIQSLSKKLSFEQHKMSSFVKILGFNFERYAKVKTELECIAGNFSPPLSVDWTDGVLCFVCSTDDLNPVKIDAILDAVIDLTDIKK